MARKAAPLMSGSLTVLDQSVDRSREGGNFNDYESCGADPINCYDLDGRFRLRGVGRFVKRNWRTITATRRSVRAR